jgi:hypothetical protein
MDTSKLTILPAKYKSADLRSSGKAPPHRPVFAQKVKANVIFFEKIPANEATHDGRWRAYGYDNLVTRDKAGLDIFLLKDLKPGGFGQPHQAGGFATTSSPTWKAHWNS